MDGEIWNGVSFEERGESSGGNVLVRMALNNCWRK